MVKTKNALRQRGKRLHQAALTTRSIVFVNNAFFSGFIEAADSHQHGFFRSFHFAARDGNAGFIHGSASRTAEIAVAQALFFVLLIAFNLRLNVSQGLPPKSFSFLQRRAILPDAFVFV
jgi:hypothetical protein